jgi:hypothetical protein
MLKKFEPNHVFRSKTVAHPKASFFANSGSVYYNNEVSSVSSSVDSGEIALGDIVHPVEEVSGSA